MMDFMGVRLFPLLFCNLTILKKFTTFFSRTTGPWRAAHIDDLSQSKDIVSDISVLQNMTISQMFEMRKAKHEGICLITMIVTFCMHAIFKFSNIK